ncbi:hypothetical protein BDA99DRAFT_529736 [Phascolomyces articulosus]|uniref:Heterokaryon incompatibility domain-containing protein n=1 Tax=Phascolomyces articulosus TaxID=60185 RepID=A0AAD5JLT2_9FUNG|nr:hypothetical protein BDA99DRAFT_529736 [Phascolomyces articulosus]
MYVKYENSQYCITSYKTVDRHPRIPFVPSPTASDGGLVSDRISIECSGMDATKLKSTSTSCGFRPTRLVRTSDFKVVCGSEATNGYCCLSYPWEWSGELATTTEHPSTTTESHQQQQRRTDRGIHLYIEHDADPFTKMMFGLAHQERDAEIDEEESEGEEEIQDNEDNDYYRSYLRRTRKQIKLDNEFFPITRRLYFTEILRQLCYMFEIDYIWYDQLCILQSDHHDKQHEIRQMHQIYGNSLFTLVMIPEMHYMNGGENTRSPPMYREIQTKNAIQRCIQEIATSKWSTRAWTFEEAVLSKRLLFAGRNVHIWSDTLVSTTNPWHVIPHTRRRSLVKKKEKDMYSSNDSMKTMLGNIYDESHLRFIQNLCSITSDSISASSALWHIHRGESTQNHDKIFALANIFPRLMDEMKMDFGYDQPLLPLMSQFYNNLIQHDLSVLCFGKAATSMDTYYGMDRRIDSIGITSWTGVSGSHMLQTPAHPMAPTTSFGKYFVTEEGYLSVYSKSISVSVDMVDRCPNESVIYSYTVKSSGELGSLKATMDRDSYLQVVSYGLTPTHWLSTCPWNPTSSTIVLCATSPPSSSSSSDTTTVWFSLVSSGEVHKRCAILIDVAFDIGMDGFMAYPVITNYGNYRTAIGMCIARNLHLLYDQKELELDEFTIR